MILIVNTTENVEITEKLHNLLQMKGADFEVIEAYNMNIGHCIGCGHCWLKDPGVCVQKDDYGEILRKIVHADQLWVIADTKLGFLNHRAKKIFDRIVPILDIYLEFRGDQMRHIMRYDTRTDLGLIYQGEADRDFLQSWSDCCTMNLDSKSLGVYKVTEWEEVAACMQ